MRISLAGPSYTSRSVVAAAQQTMNLYAEPVEAQNEPRLVLYGRPGLKLFKALTGAAKIRGMWSGGGRLFVIHGGTLSELTEAAAQTDRSGTLASGSSWWPFPGEDWPTPDPAQIFSNGHQLLIISGGLVYCDNGAGPQPARFNLNGLVDTDGTTTVYWTSSGTTPETSDVFTPQMVGQTIRIGDDDYVVASFVSSSAITVGTAVPVGSDQAYTCPRAGDQVTGVTGGFLDGYGLVSRPPTPAGSLFNLPARRRTNRSGVAEDLGRQFNWSAPYDFTLWDPLDFGVKEGNSDYLHSILCDHEELWLFGTETTEVWGNVGGDFTFARNPGAFIHEGTSAVYAPCSVGLSVCGLAGGANGETVAFQISGLQPKRISTHAQEQEWNATGFQVNDATSYGYSEGGHTFWVVNFWTAARSWVYDLTTQLWHERSFWDTSIDVFKRQQAWFHAFLPEWGTNGKHIVGDPTTGKLYEMSSNYTDDDGAAILYRRAFPHLINEDNWAYIHRLEILAEMGALTGGDTVPQMVLDGSRDYGHTFINPRPVPMGSSGQYTRRAVWRRLGKARDWVPRVTIEAKVKIALIDAYLEATQGFA